MSNFSQDIDDVLLPLKGKLSFSRIRTEKVLMLTYAILVQDTHVDSFENDDNPERNPKRLEDTRENMIKQIELLRSRDSIFKESDYDALITDLNNLEYIEADTLPNIVKKRKLHTWHQMYKRVGCETHDVSLIIRQLSVWAKKVNDCSKKESEQINLMLYKWRKGIDKQFHNDAIALYNRLECYAEDFETLYPQEKN